jgi:hypothetical protein
MKGLECAICGRIAKEAELEFNGKAISGWKCECGEEYFEPAQAERILLLNKLKNSDLKAKVGQIRSNLIVRIPKEVEKALELRKGEELKIKVASKQKIELITA